MMDIRGLVGLLKKCCYIWRFSWKAETPTEGNEQCYKVGEIAEGPVKAFVHMLG
jgi:hypothetical protein